MLDVNHIRPQDTQSDAYRAWVKSRVALAREYFKAGKEYFSRVQNARCRLACFAYIARFEWLLDTFEREGYCPAPAIPRKKEHTDGSVHELAYTVIPAQCPGGRSPVPAQLSSFNRRTMKTKSVIVIGAGIGGLTAAIHLARHGLYVTVLEKNSHPGGRCDRFSRDGHHFDTGPTLFVMPLLYEAEFRVLGTSLHEQLDLQRVDPTYHLVFDDGTRLALTSDLKSMRDALESISAGKFPGLSPLSAGRGTPLPAGHGSPGQL